jgi:hypothetical protein
VEVYQERGCLSIRKSSVTKLDADGTAISTDLQDYVAGPRPLVSWVRTDRQHH